MKALAIKDKKIGLILIGIGAFIIGSVFITKKIIFTRKMRVMVNVIGKWGNKIKYYAQNYGIDPHLFAALITQESEGSERAKRHEPGYFDRLMRVESGWRLSPYANKPDITDYSYGLTQLMFSTYLQTKYGKPACYSTYLPYWGIILDPDENLKYGAKFLKVQLNNYGNDYRDALAAYNAGVNLEAGYSYADTVLQLFNTVPRDVWGGI